MNWLVFALLSPAIYTIVAFTDSYIIEREVQQPRAMAIFSALVAVLIGTIFFILSGYQTLPLPDALLAMLAGAFTTFGVIFYFEALSRANTSSVVVLFQMVPIFVLTIAFFFLHERISLRQFIGFLLILSASVVVSIEGGERIRLSSAFFLTVGVDLLWAGSSILLKVVSDKYPFLPVAAYESFGLAMGGILLFVFLRSVRDAFLTSLRTARQQTFAAIGLSESLFVAAKLCDLMAISLGPVALVSVVGGTQVFFALLAGWALTLVAPTIFNEDIRRHILLRKGLMAVVVIIGVYLVS